MQGGAYPSSRAGTGLQVLFFARDRPGLPAVQTQLEIVLSESLAPAAVVPAPFELLLSVLSHRLVSGCHCP